MGWFLVVNARTQAEARKKFPSAYRRKYGGSKVPVSEFTITSIRAPDRGVLKRSGIKEWTIEFGEKEARRKK